MTDTQTQTPGLGALERPRSRKDHVMLAFATASPAFDWTKAPADDGDPQPNAFGIPDKEQGSGGSCTCQTAGYGMFKAIGKDISRHEPYCHIHLPGPGGGAYLNAPYDWLRQNGYFLLDRYPDPNPQTEANMQEILVVQDGDRVRNFQLTYKISPVVTIDAAALTIQQYSFAVLGIRVSFASGWNGSWTDPKYTGAVDGNHALFAGAAVIRGGKKAIKCKSSWTNHTDNVGKRSYVHFINEDYFNNGGAFEIIGVNVQELTGMEQKFTIQIGGALGVITVTPEGFISGKLAENAVEYSKLGKQLAIPTCDVDSNGTGSNFGPVNFTKTA